jgi:hypothetical protein
MKKLRLIAGLALMLLVSIPLLTSLSSCKKKCKCNIAPTNLSFVEEQDGLVFTFKSSGGADGYVITITNPLTGAKIEDGFTLNSADPKKRKVLKANFPSFFQPATFYQATIHRDCGRVSGCPKEVSEKTPSILIQTKAGSSGVPGPNIVQLIGSCDEYTFVVDSVSGAGKYLLFSYDEETMSCTLIPLAPASSVLGKHKSVQPSGAQHDRVNAVLIMQRL